MPHRMREELERQVARLLEEAERPMRVEEIVPHLDPVMPSPNDVAEVLQEMATHHEVEREGSFFAKPTPVPIDHLFRLPEQRANAHAIVELIRDLDGASGEGARTPAVVKAAAGKGVSAEAALHALTILRNAGEVYSVGGDRVRLAKP